MAVPDLYYGLRMAECVLHLRWHGVCLVGFLADLRVKHAGVVDQDFGKGAIFHSGQPPAIHGNGEGPVEEALQQTGNMGHYRRPFLRDMG